MSTIPSVEEFLLAFRGRTDAMGVMLNGKPLSIKTSNEDQVKEVIKKHRSGEQRAGVYNVLEGDLVNFAVVDFDSHGNAAEDHVTLMEQLSARCQELLEEKGAICHREISKSGRGNYHIWIFFDEPLEASKVRRNLSGFLAPLIPSKADTRIALEIFPKQDTLNGGIGNFVWLPFFPPDVKIGRTVFMDVEGNFVTPSFGKCPKLALNGLLNQQSLSLVNESPVVVGKRKTETPFDLLSRNDIPEGERHTALTRIIGHFKMERISQKEALVLTKKWNVDLLAPLPQAEVESTLLSLYRDAVDGKEEPVVDPAEFLPLSIAGLLDTLGMTIKQDDSNKLITFLVALSAYTEDSQINLSFNAPTSTGKSFIPTEIVQLFPRHDVIVTGYCSPNAFFHDHGSFDKEKNGYVMDLSHKVLIFLDQPKPDLLERLRPMLSHDKKEILVKIVDKTQHSGNRTKNIFLIGYPAVIFCTASLRMDEQESSRFLVLSPQTSAEKIRQGILEKISKESNPSRYREWLNGDPRRILLKARIRAICEQGITEIRIANEEDIREGFFSRKKSLAPRDQRDIGRIIGLIRSFALLNCWFRDREGSIIYANDEDIQNGFDTWRSVSRSQELNLPPFVLDFYDYVLLGAYAEHERETGSTLIGGNRPDGITRKDIHRRFMEVNGRPLSDAYLRQQLLQTLEAAGLITQEQDPSDRRRMLIYPIPADTIPKVGNSEGTLGVEEGT